MSNEMRNLYTYILEEFPTVYTSHYTRDLLFNILFESEKIVNIGERCEWLSRILPEMSLREIRDVLLR